jgi:hypothetical protein
MKFIVKHILAGLVLCCTVSGCATWSQHGVVLHSQKLPVAVLPVRNEVTVKRLEDLRTLPETETTHTNESVLIQREMQQAANVIRGDVEKGLCNSYFFEVIPDARVGQALTALGLESYGASLSTNQVIALGQATGATVILFTRISGYGKIKKKWLVLLVGSGLVEGVVQGGIAAYAVGNGWVAVGVAAEEILQEALTWGGGAWLFNRIYTPVILETELFSAVDGQVIWTDTSMARINRKALKKLPKEESKKKEIRLQKTAEAAVEDMLKALNEKAFQNVE